MYSGDATLSQCTPQRFQYNMDWWHDDPELLSATLSILASAEIEQEPSGVDTLPELPVTVSPGFDTALLIPSASSSSTEGDDTSTSAPQATEKKPKRAVNVSRERRRNETRYLRAKVVELESQLSILQHRRELMLRPHHSETGEIRSVAPVWEMIATRQVRELRRSEVVNTKLKDLVQAQLKVAHDMIAAIHKAEEESKRLLRQEGLVTVSRPRLAIDISQNISEEEQLQRLEELCTRSHDVFESVDKFRDGVSLRFRDIELVEDNGVEAVVDVCGSWAVPFATENVEEVFWRFFLDEFAEEDDGHSFVQDYESRDDTIIGVFRALSTIDNHRTTFEGKFVGKRLRSTDGHLVIVTHMYSEPRCKSNLLEDVALEEDSWLRIVDSHAVGSPKLGHPLTIMQHVRRMNIRFGKSYFMEDSDSNDSAGKRRRAGALTEFLMRQVEDEFIQVERCLENMLLDSFTKLKISSPSISDDGLNVVL